MSQRQNFDANTRIDSLEKEVAFLRAQLEKTQSILHKAGLLNEVAPVTVSTSHSAPTSLVAAAQAAGGSPFTASRISQPDLSLPDKETFDKLPPNQQQAWIRSIFE